MARPDKLPGHESESSANWERAYPKNPVSIGSGPLYQLPCRHLEAWVSFLSDILL